MEELFDVPGLLYGFYESFVSYMYVIMHKEGSLSSILLAWQRMHILDSDFKFAPGRYR